MHVYIYIYIYIHPHKNQQILFKYIIWKVLLSWCITKLCKCFFFEHLSDFAIFLNHKRATLHFDAGADLVEWEPNMLAFIPDSVITITHHLQRLVVEIGLCGCSKLNNNWFVPIFLKGAFILIYCLRWAAT